MPGTMIHFVDRCILAAHGTHDCREQHITQILGSIHDVLLKIFGKNCIMHGLFNGHDSHHSQLDIGILGQSSPSFFADLLRKYPPRGNQPRLSAIINYQTRSRVSQAHYLFDHTINHAAISFTLPLERLPRKQVVTLATTICNTMSPELLIYHNHMLMDALHQERPEPPPAPLKLPGGTANEDDHVTQFDAKWITYDPARRVPQNLDLPTIDRIELDHAPLFVAKPEYFHTTDQSLISDLIQLHDALNEE